MNLNTTMTTLGALVLAAGTALGAEPTDLSIDVTNAYHNELSADASSHASFGTNVSEYAPKVFGFFQARYQANFSDGYTFSTEDMTTGFEFGTTRLGVKGSIHPRVSYSVVGEFARSGGGFTLLDAYADIELNDDWDLRAGQFTLGYLREQNVSRSKQLTSERSVTNGFFSQGRAQAISLRYAKDKLRADIAFSDGGNTTNTAYNAATEADYAFSGRLEYLGAGNWDQFNDFTSWRGSDKAWMLGGAVHFQDGGSTGATGGSTASTQILGATADFSMEFDGANLYGAFIYQSMDGAAGDFDDFGVIVQGGYFFTDIVEAFARWDAVFADSNRTLNDDFHAVTAGINYYLIENSHAAKLTFEGSYYPEGQSTSPIAPSTATGVLGSTDEQFNLRAQLQIVF
ncbi:MAG: hypothetical protein DHS20C14_02920 [Phycisphaeraceae bacterium]|nr:MAG: hypothetical protein DHS20C14_02920 [Phycisphaeraceae bacterium]